MVDRQDALGLPLAEPLDEAVILGFSADVRGPLIRPEDDGYDATRGPVMVVRH
jgi:hypothetical protein